ncbi:unnamed protein product [Closterium sp. NIES-65]|nr:unnamed protein product [Closterium sp. NIES-65]
MTSPFDNDALPRNAANYAPLTPLTFIRRAADVHGDRCAVVYGDHSWTWRQTYRRCCKLASALRRRGIGKNDTVRPSVAVLAPNLPALYEAHFGEPIAGAALNAINTRLDAHTVSVLARNVPALYGAHFGVRMVGDVLNAHLDALLAPNVPALYEAHFGVPMAGAVLNAINTRLDARAVVLILIPSPCPLCPPSTTLYPNPQVSVLAPNVPALYEAHFGVPMAGAVLNAINTRLDARTVALILAHGSARLVMAHRSLAPLLTDALLLLPGLLREKGRVSGMPQVVIIEDDEEPSDQSDPGGSAADVAALAASLNRGGRGEGGRGGRGRGGERGGVVTYEELVGEGDEQYEWEWEGGEEGVQGEGRRRVVVEDEWDAIALNYTSGTTAQPKGVVCSHRGAYLSALANVLAWGLHALPGGQRPVYLWTLPLFHCNGWTYPWVLAAVAGTNVCCREVCGGAERGVWGGVLQAGRYVEGQREVYGGVCCKQVWPLFHCNGWTYPWVLATVVGTNVCWREVCGEVGYGMVGCAAVGCGMVGRGTVGHGTIGRGTVGRGTVGRGTVGRGMVGRGTVGRGTVGRGTVGCGMEGCAVVRCGVEGCCVEGCGVEGCGVEGCGLVGCGLVTAASIFSLIPRHRVTHMCASPVVLPFLIHAPSSLTQPPPHLPRSQHLLSRSLAPRHPHVCRARGALLSHPRPRLPHPPPSPPLHQVTAASIFSHIPQHQVAATSIFSLIPRHRVTHMCAAPVVLSFLIHAPDSLQPCVPSPPHQVTAASIFSLIPRHRVTHMCAAPVVLSFLIHAPDSLRLPFLAAQRAQGRGGGDYSEGRWEGNSEGSREGRRGGYSEGNREGSSGGGQEARRVHVMTAGAAPPPAVLAGIEAMGFDVLHAYGLTETYGPAVVCEWQQERWRGADESERARLKARQVGKRGGGALEVDRGDGGIEAMGFEVMHAYGLMETYGPAVVCEWQQERWRGADESEQSRLKARQQQPFSFTTSPPAPAPFTTSPLNPSPSTTSPLNPCPFTTSPPQPLSLLSLLLHPSPFTTSPSQPLLLPPLLAPPSLPPSPPHRQGVRCMALEGLAVMDPVTMRHVAADGRSMGEVMLRGNMVMKGYAADRGATEAAFRGGWFHSGDLAVMHPDGYIEVKDRSKDIIISGGENVSSIAVEAVLYRHPSVLEAAVVARPDTMWGESVCAFVCRKPGQQHARVEAMPSALRSSARHLRSAFTTTAAAFTARPALPRMPCIAASLESAVSMRRVPQPPARPSAVAPSFHASPPLQAPPVASDLLARFQLVSCAPRFSISAQEALTRTLVALPRALAVGRAPSPASAAPTLRAAHTAVVAARAAGVGQARGVFVEAQDQATHGKRHKGGAGNAAEITPMPLLLPLLPSQPFPSPAYRFKINLRTDNAIHVARARSHYWKGAELKRLRAEEAEIRWQQREFRQKLDWTMAKHARWVGWDEGRMVKRFRYGGASMGAKPSTPGMGKPCRYGQALQVWASLTGTGKPCRYGQALQVRASPAGTGKPCRYGQALQVRASPAGLGKPCRYGQALQPLYYTPFYTLLPSQTPLTPPCPLSPSFHFPLVFPILSPLSALSYPSSPPYPTTSLRPVLSPHPSSPFPLSALHPSQTPLSPHATHLLFTPVLPSAVTLLVHQMDGRLA